MASRVAALLLLGLICFRLAAADVPTDCCLQTVDKKVPHQVVVSYYIQEADKGCSISATVFLTKNGRKLCVVHPSMSPLVQSVIDAVDRRKQ
ncbi:C-C motif chemokine 3-like [Parambassis ranga]|uniref:C-C motif chemokine 3-like n=1 Tax=Parambassis ranga TaxID=210632 RepID=A0A6P7J2J1_9TELE|nr:C-C motif chemokine 3-like [Parambassis ranga]